MMLLLDWTQLVCLPAFLHGPRYRAAQHRHTDAHEAYRRAVYSLPPTLQLARPSPEQRVMLERLRSKRVKS